MIKKIGNTEIKFKHNASCHPTEYGVNLGCLEGVNPFDLGEVVTNDGVHHPADRSAL
jgi:hypothetical protein